MKSAKPLLLLSIYYALLIGACYLVLLVLPALAVHLPFGGAENISSGMSEFMSGKATRVVSENETPTIGFALSLLGVLLLMQPVAWIYMGARRRKGRDQAFILTILLLPVVVAGIVIIVQNSLALAFSLAGIVAGVRFRLTLDDTLDAIYIFVAIGVGLAAGTGALEIGIVVTLFFNYAVLILWQVDYGAEVSVGRWYTKTWMNVGPSENDEEV